MKAKKAALMILAAVALFGMAVSVDQDQQQQQDRLLQFLSLTSVPSDVPFVDRPLGLSCSQVTISEPIPKRGHLEWRDRVVTVCRKPWEDPTNRLMYIF
jgi:hypothetical protein